MIRIVLKANGVILTAIPFFRTKNVPYYLIRSKIVSIFTIMSLFRDKADFFYYEDNRPRLQFKGRPIDTMKE